MSVPYMMFILLACWDAPAVRYEIALGILGILWAHWIDGYMQIL